MKRRSLTERFWENVDKKNGPIHPYKPHLGRCWLWTACTGRGHGHIRENAPSTKTLKAHRVSYELHNGPIPISEGYHGTCVLHTCDNRPCVNPRHLYLGPHRDNVDDRQKRERQAKHEQHGIAKLTEEQVAEIRRVYVKGSRTHGQRALAKKYCMAQSTISAMLKGETWK